MNKPDPAPQALNDLEASLKRVLLHTGSALIHSNGNAGVQMDSARRDLRKTLPEALSQWYDGLAVLEKQLATSKAILHRDLARLRPSQQTEQQPQNASPTNSLDSDTVMVEVPSQDQTVNNGAPAQTQGSTQSLSVQAGGLSASTWKQPAAPAITTTQPEHDIEAHRQFAYSQQQPLHKIDAPEQPASNTAASHEDQSKLRADTPRPSTETMQASDDQANDVTNELADTDFRTLLPGIEDFANGSGGVAGDGMNLDELTSENLFGDDPVNTLQGTDEGRGAGSGDFFDDDGITSEGVPGNFSNQTSQFDFSDMNFRGLVPSGGAGNDGNQGANANFDFLNLEDDFWNLTGSNDAH